MNAIKRAKAPTPKFFKAVGGTVLAAPIALPVIVTSVAGYLAVAGGILSAVSQLTTTTEKADRTQ
jgi:uncharacterized membrane protein HdeD (DUF308 family)